MIFEELQPNTLKPPRHYDWQIRRGVKRLARLFSIPEASSPDDVILGEFSWLPKVEIEEKETGATSQVLEHQDEHGRSIMYKSPDIDKLNDFGDTDPTYSSQEVTVWQREKEALEELGTDSPSGIQSFKGLGVARLPQRNNNKQVLRVPVIRSERAGQTSLLDLWPTVLDQPRALLLPIFEQLANRLDYVHQQGWIHGDVTNGNVRIDFTKEGEPQITLIDFGNAERLTSENRYDDQARFAAMLASALENMQGKNEQLEAYQKKLDDFVFTRDYAQHPLGEYTCQQLAEGLREAMQDST